MNFWPSLSRTLVGLPVLMTLLPLWRTGRGWVRIWDFPRGQIVGLGAIGAACMLKQNGMRKADKLLLAALGGSIAYQSAKIIPYTRLWKPQVPSAKAVDPDCTIRLLMANVLMHNHRFDLMRKVVEEANADVICLVETDDRWECEMRQLDRDYAWSNKCVLGNTYGMLLYSRLPLIDPITRFLVQEGVPSMRAAVRLPSGDDIMLYCLHPKPPMPDTSSYGRDAELVIVGTELDASRKPSIVMGDLNDVAWSYTTTLFKRISHTVDPRVGRGMYNTFHADHAWARYPLDHIFHTRDFTVVELRRMSHTGSDHFPVLVELAYTPSRKNEIEHPTATVADVEAAQEILEDAGEQGLIGGQPDA